MPFERIDNGDFSGLVISEREIAVGVLTNAAIVVENATIPYGACVAHLYLAVNDIAQHFAQIPLAHGIISRMTPLSWIGNVTIPEGCHLVAEIRGHQVGPIRICWERQTVTNVKETGNVERAITKPTT